MKRKIIIGIIILIVALFSYTVGRFVDYAIEDDCVYELDRKIRNLEKEDNKNNKPVVELINMSKEDNLDKVKIEEEKLKGNKIVEEIVAEKKEIEKEKQTMEDFSKRFR